MLCSFLGSNQSLHCIIFHSVQYLFGINPEFMLKFPLCCSLHPYCSIVLKLSWGMERMTTTGVGKVTCQKKNQQMETGREMKFKDKVPCQQTINSYRLEKKKESMNKCKLFKSYVPCPHLQENLFFAILFLISAPALISLPSSFFSHCRKIRAPFGYLIIILNFLG